MGLSDGLYLFAFRPQGPIIEVIEFLTNIIPGRDGSQQRICVRPLPRQSFKFPLLLQSEQDQAKLDAALFSWQKKTWALPIWPEMELHTETVNAEDTVINVDTSYADFRANSLAVIWKSPAQAEILEVETVGPTSLSLLAAVEHTYSGRKLIMPCRRAWIAAMVTRQIHGPGPAALELFFEIEDNILLSGYTPPYTYKGRPILREATAIEPTQAKSSDGDVTVVDFETGPVLRSSESDFNIYLQSHLFHNDTKAACWEFRKMLHALKGGQGTLYIPTFKSDMVLAEGFGPSDTTFSIEAMGLADNMGVNELRADLAFVFEDGPPYYREIVDIEDQGATEVVTMDSALGIAVNPGDCVICFVDQVTLPDYIQITWPQAHQNRSAVQCTAVKA